MIRCEREVVEPVLFAGGRREVEGPGVACCGGEEGK